MGTVLEVIVLLVVIFLFIAALEGLRYFSKSRKSNRLYRLYLNGEFVKECSYRECRAYYQTRDYVNSKGSRENKKDRIFEVDVDSYIMKVLSSSPENEK